MFHLLVLHEEWAFVFPTVLVFALVAGILKFPRLVIRALQIAVLLAFIRAIFARMEPLKIHVVVTFGVAVLGTMFATVLAGVDVRVVIAGKNAVRGASIIAALARVVIFIPVLAGRIEMADLLVRILRVVQPHHTIPSKTNFLSSSTHGMRSLASGCS